ncbi:hypothetical protein [Streptomyces sp. B21-101]|uniref:hypothetical protein n=1 Tax=Streptomyces sp. B21-101 TaxID=3039415 RepID=UPI002FF408CE
MTVVADHDQRLLQQRQAARHTPLTVREARIVRLDRDVNGPLPRLRRLTPDEQRRNMNRLLAAASAPARKAG